MRNASTSRLARSLFLCLALHGSLVSDASAATYTWTNTSICLFGGCNWSASGFWSPSGYPDAGDSATIARSTTVRLVEPIGALTALSLSDGARLQTGGYALNVAAGNSNTSITGNGTAGASTYLRVDSGAPLGFDFFGFFVALLNGAELRMNGGGALASFGIYVSPSSLISGHGSVILLNGGNKLDIAGTIRPSGGDLLIWSQAEEALDLDGDIAGVEHGNIDVTSTGNLEIRGSLEDPFSGLMTIGMRNDVEFDSAVEIDGRVEFTSSIGSHLIAPEIAFRDGVEVVVDGAIAYIDAETRWPYGAMIDLVAETDELHLTSDSHFGASSVWSGRGVLVNESAAWMHLADGVEVDVALRNEGILEIANSMNDGSGFVVLDDFEQSGGTVVFDIEGTTPGVDFDQIHVTGDLTLGGDFQVAHSANLDIEQGDSFELIKVDGVATGAFSGVADGDYVANIDGEDLYLTYAGGDGNDVVLYTLPEPGLATGLGLGVLAIAGVRRSRSLAV